MTRILFAELLQPKLDVLRADGKGTYWSQLQRLVAQQASCPTDWVLRFDTNRIRRERQYDKSEPVITYYMLTALSLATDGFRDEHKLRTLFQRAFNVAESVESVVSHLATSGWGNLTFEALIAPTDEMRKSVQANVSTIPVAYLREIAEKRPGVRFESPTHLDAFIGASEPLINGGGKIGLGFEAKFTSDIDSHTTYSTHRNQIVRNIEVGHGRFEEFYFLLVTPRIYRQRRSRFYVYKAEEYMGENGPDALIKDCLAPSSFETASKWSAQFGYLCWEDLIDVIAPNGQPAFEHEDADALVSFLRERGLLS